MNRLSNLSWKCLGIGVIIGMLIGPAALWAGGRSGDMLFKYNNPEEWSEIQNVKAKRFMLVWDFDIEHPDGAVTNRQHLFTPIYRSLEECRLKQDEAETRLPLEKVRTEDGGKGIVSRWLCLPIPGEDVK